MTRRGPNEGSIHQRKDGRWVGSVHLGYEPGRRVRKHVFGRTRAEVEELKPLLRARDEQRPVPDARLTIGTFLHTWLEDVARPAIRASTYDSYRDIVELHLVPGLGRIRLAKLSPTDVQAFLTKKADSGLSARRVQMLHAVLRRALRIAEEWGFVSRNVARLVRPPRVTRKEIVPLTPEQASLLIHVVQGAPARRPLGHGAGDRVATGRAARAALGGCRPPWGWTRCWGPVATMAGRTGTSSSSPLPM